MATIFAAFMEVAIIDNGTGNLHSIFRMLVSLKVQPKIVDHPSKLLDADKIILPGVGHFGRAMAQLRHAGLEDALTELVVVKHKPILGICLGMQMLLDSSDEAPGIAGLGWIGGKVSAITPTDKERFKRLHIGWNTLHTKNNNRLLEHISEKDELYFLHSYAMHQPVDSTTIATTTYEQEFVSVINKDHIFGVQFHPEKSQEAGQKVLNNFLAI